MARKSRIEQLSVVADPWNLYHMKLSDFRITLQNYKLGIPFTQVENRYPDDYIAIFLICCSSFDNDQILFEFKNLKVVGLSEWDSQHPCYCKVCRCALWCFCAENCARGCFLGRDWV